MTAYDPHDDPYDPEDDFCESEMVDGVWTNCGCSDCAQQACESIEHDVEYGAISEEYAIALHEQLGC